MSFFGRVRHHAQRQIKGFDRRVKFANMVGFLLPRPESTSVEGDRQIVETLRSDGYAELPNIATEEQIADILAYLADHKVMNPYNPSLGEFDVSDRSVKSNIGSYSDEVLSGCPHLLNIANTPLLISAISQFFGRKPTLSKVALWHSFPTNEGAQNAENYHRDVDDVMFLKVFIYLSDVDEASGPHIYIRGSHANREFLTVRRFTDEEIETRFPKDEVLVLTGKAGSAFIENTYGLHKGLVARAQQRTLLQFEYSLFPIGAYSYSNRYRDAERHDRYVNRLLS